MEAEEFLVLIGASTKEHVTVIHDNYYEDVTKAKINLTKLNEFKEQREPIIEYYFFKIFLSR